MDEDVVVATAMVFIMAGYDTTATLLSYGSYALAKNPEVQKRLQEEVDEAFADAEGDFPEYSAVQELPYLDMVVHETLRMYNPVPMNNREATVDYKIPGTEVHFSKEGISSVFVFSYPGQPEERGPFELLRARSPPRPCPLVPPGRILSGALQQGGEGNKESVRFPGFWSRCSMLICDFYLQLIL